MKRKPSIACIVCVLVLITIFCLKIRGNAWSFKNPSKTQTQVFLYTIFMEEKGQ